MGLAVIAVGIDPGTTGAVAFVDSRGSCAVFDLPTIALEGSGTIRRRVSGGGLFSLLREHCPIGEPVVGMLEGVHAIARHSSAANAIQTQGSLMRSTGSIEAALEIARISFEFVDPKRWKGFYALGSDKAEALACARRLYPLAELHLAKHHNRAESILIAHFCLRSRE